MMAAIESFARKFDVSSALLYFLVVVALPLFLWFVLRGISLHKQCPDHAQCKGLAVLDKESSTIELRLRCQFLASFACAGLLLAYGLQSGFRKILHRARVFNVIVADGPLPTEYVSLAFLIVQLQMVLHVLHMESSFAAKVSCPKAWNSRWSNLRVANAALLLGLCMVGMSRVIKLLQSNSSCWFTDYDWQPSITVAVLIVTSISIDNGGFTGSVIRLFFLILTLISIKSTADKEAELLPAYEILLWSLVTALTHMIVSTKLYNPSGKPLKLLCSALLTTLTPLLLQSIQPCASSMS